MEWKTRITEMIGIRYPIMEGALAVIGTADLAAPVSEAGGLGTITAWTLRTPERLREEIRKLRSMTDKPFAVNLSPAMDPGLDAMREAAIDERVPVIETAGSRAAHHGVPVKEAGLIWIHKVQTVQHALAAERDGADAVCIMGAEGAGLKSRLIIPTLVSVPMAVRRLKIPVIAAGGIGDARGFLAALAMGAEAVQLGTVFCAVRECPLAEYHKQALVAADPFDPKWRDPILATPTADDVRKLREATDTKEVMLAAARAESTGIPKEAGTGALSLAIGFIDRIQTVSELIDGIIGEAEEILTTRGIGGWRLVPPTSS
jgi:NAD(P)H-dependent flavin oxidoreductase YrpB (nitropropane dioxygenase family)